MVRELEKHIAQLIVPIEEQELAKRFDYLMYTIELAQLQGLPFAKPKVKVVRTAERLAEKGNLTQVKQHAQLIEDVQTSEYWESATILHHERVRLALRDLLVLLEKENTGIYYTSFADEVLAVAENPGEYGVSELQSYRQKVNAYLKQHQDDLVVFKLRNNKPLTTSDFTHIEKLLWHELGTKEDYQRVYGDEPLLKLVATLVGLEPAAANALFSEFISDQTLNSQQMEFVTLVVNHVAQNGVLEKAILNDHPFNKYGNIVALFDGKIEVAKQIISRIDTLNNRLQMEG